MIQFGEYRLVSPGMTAATAYIGDFTQTQLA
jgi:hypothetical protein